MEMSASGPKRTRANDRHMSALEAKADVTLTHVTQSGYLRLERIASKDLQFACSIKKEN
jgi:hypothetical protein